MQISEHGLNLDLFQNKIQSNLYIKGTQDYIFNGPSINYMDEHFLTKKPV